MARCSTGLFVVVFFGTASGLQLGNMQVASRRSAIGGCIAALAPIAPSFAIVNPLDRGEVQFKKRNYGDMEPPGSKPAAPLAGCKKLKPDGFGGKVCRDEEVKPLLAKVLSGDEPAPAPVAVAAAPQKSVGESTRSSSVSEAPLTLEGLIEASIKNKEEVLGRELDAEEKMEIASKVTRLMAAKK